MSDQIVRDSKLALTPSWKLRNRNEADMKPSEKIVTFIGPQSEAARDNGEGRDSSGKSRDWTSALHLIREANEAIRINEERAAELEAQLDKLTEEANDEIHRLEARIATSEERIARTEERARAAEKRANEAEAWLARLHDAIHEAFVRPPNAATRIAGRSDQDEGHSEQQVARS